MLLGLDTIWRLRNEVVCKRQHISPLKAIIMIVRTRDIHRVVFDNLSSSVGSDLDYANLSFFIALSSHEGLTIDVDHSDVGLQ